MEISDSFLEPEVRNGFYISSEVKQAWAAELEVLQEIDRICKKYEIPYFADWGTLLGAVRHGGFIPWDDDLDITMKRADYEKFLRVAQNEMQDDFAVFTYATHPDFWNFLARFVAKNRICFEKEHLRKFHGFPYIVGIDIFVLDYVADNEEEEEERDRLARYVIEVADAIADGKISDTYAESALNGIEKMFHIVIKNREDIHQLRVQLYGVAEKLFAKFPENESKYLTRMMPNGLYKNKSLRLSKKYYEKQIWLPFENTFIPVPSGYDEMLRKRYGDYMKLVRNSGGHDYPFFEAQRKQLQSVLDFEMPGYKYTGIVTRDSESGKKKSFKAIIEQAYCELINYFDLIKKQSEPDFALLQTSQQLAIDMGTLIEQCKGEGHPTVSILEKCCEVLFQICQYYSLDLLNELDELGTKLWESVQKNILERKEIAFLPYKSSEWRYIQSVWQAAMDDENCDVYVMPIPYYYKEWDGALGVEKYEAELFPNNVKIVRYDEFDFELHYPDTIYIQNPYDEFNPVISVHTFFYSTNLKKYTEQLVYIPPFILEEFNKDSYREYHNMQYYCTMPGVVNADKVIVQSENMKQLYVEKLTEFAGEDTREIWKEKISEFSSPIEDIQNSFQNDNTYIPEEWRLLIEKKDGGRKKVILYYTSLCSFVQYGEEMCAKMKEVFQLFYEKRESVVMLWKPHSLIKTSLEQLNPSMYQEYCLLKDEYLEQKIGILDESLDDELAVSICDAYYGDTSSMVQMCRNKGKAVLIQDVKIRGHI